MISLFPSNTQFPRRLLFIKSTSRPLLGGTSGSQGRSQQPRNWSQTVCPNPEPVCLSALECDTISAAGTYRHGLTSNENSHSVILLFQNILLWFFQISLESLLSKKKIIIIIPLRFLTKLIWRKTAIFTEFSLSIQGPDICLTYFIFNTHATP